MDTITASFASMSGGILLMALPLCIALGVGLVMVGLIKQKLSAVAGGVVLPIAVGIAGQSLTSWALSTTANPLATASSIATMGSFMPIAVIFGLVVFLMVILPGIVRAARGGDRKRSARPAHWR